jgi:hypothetical protein
LLNFPRVMSFSGSSGRNEEKMIRTKFKSHNMFGHNKTNI